MTSKQTNQKKSLPMFWLVLIGSILGLLLILFFQPDREAIDNRLLPWNAQFDKSGKLHALGLTIHESTLADAMTLYGKDVEVKIFSNQDESNKSLEAYFPVMYIGAIKAALAVRLEVSPAELDAAYAMGKTITTNTSGMREVELYSSELEKLLSKNISSLTLVPRNHLTERAISKRFGEPDHKEIQSDNLPHLFFDKLGLEMIIDQEGPDALQYTTRPTEQ